MKSLKYIATLLIVVLVLSACSNNKSLYSDDGQVFRKVITQDISTLDGINYRCSIRRYSWPSI